MAEKMTEEEKAKAEQHQRNLDQMAEQAKILPTPSVEEVNKEMELVNIEKLAEARKKVEKVSEAEASSKEHGGYKTRDMKSK